jgi:hypothetical protein
VHSSKCISFNSLNSKTGAAELLNNSPGASFTKTLYREPTEEEKEQIRLIVDKLEDKDNI